MFDFRLLRSLPKPKLSMLFCVLTFCCLACSYWHWFAPRPAGTPQDLNGAVHEFLCCEWSEHPKHPQVLLAGSSLCGMGFHVEELEKRMGMPAAKIALDGGSTKDMFDILECYPNECKYANIVFLEHAPERLKAEQRVERERFFDDIRGVRNFDMYSDILMRSSMPYFIQQKRKDMNPDGFDFFETIWDNPKYRARKEAEKIPLRQQAEQARENRKNSVTENLPLMFRITESKDRATYRQEQFEAVHRLLDLCRNRNVFVVVCITPQWYGQLNFTQHDLEIPTEEPYLLLLQDINKRPDCSVIICRDFEEITDEGTDEDYLFDYGHMTRQGAIVYTNWLADRLEETPKIADAIRQRRPIDEEMPVIGTLPTTTR